MKPSKLDTIGSSDEVLATIRGLMRQVDFTGATPLSDTLLLLLGCPFEEDYTSSLTYRRQTLNHPILAEHRDEVAAALLALVPLVAKKTAQPICAVASILAGLVRSDGWKACLERESTTYDLATLVLVFVADYTSNYEPDRLAAPDVISLLNGWLKPPVRWSKLPDWEEVARHMFGDAYCEFQLRLSIPLVGEAVYRDRPAFLPGVCPAESPIWGGALPIEIGLST